MLRHNGIAIWRSNRIKKYVQTLPENIEYHKRTMEQENKTQSRSELDSDQESKDDSYKIQQNIELMKRNLIKKASEKLYAFKIPIKTSSLE